jgi:hypothetical protein
MPPLGNATRKFRKEYLDYAGVDQTTHYRALRYFDVEVQNALETPNGGGYEHNIYCIKRGGKWEVFASAVILLNGDAWQIKDRVPYKIGDFDD